MAEPTSYYLHIDGQQLGPMNVEAVRELVRQGRVGGETLTWAEGMENWLPASQTPLAALLTAVMAPPPPPAGRPMAPTADAANNAMTAFAAGIGNAFEGVQTGSSAIPGIGFVDAVKRAFAKYATFSGRASRSEYWWFFLFNMIVSLVLTIVFAPLSAVYSLATLVPGIAIGVRRLHDIGRSGWWLLIGFVPLVGVVVLIVFFVMQSDPRQNQYG